MISSSSSLASSMPATSLNVTFCVFSLNSLARLLPNDMALPPPICIWRMKKIHTPINSRTGNHWMKAITYQGSPSSGLAVILTSLLRNRGISSGSSGAYVLNLSLEWYLPVMFWP